MEGEDDGGGGGGDSVIATVAEVAAVPSAEEDEDDGRSNMTSIEKLDKVSGEWRVVTVLEGEERFGCGAACMGSKIYVFGGGGDLSTTWNFFDVETEQWASASTSVEHRQLPREFCAGSALVVPSSTFTYT